MKRYGERRLLEFQKTFATEEACAQHLQAMRWPEGFVCPPVWPSSGVGGRETPPLGPSRHFQCEGSHPRAHRGLSEKHLQAYLSEIAYRFNPRYWERELFDRLNKHFTGFTITAGNA